MFKWFSAGFYWFLGVFFLIFVVYQLRLSGQRGHKHGQWNPRTKWRIIAGRITNINFRDFPASHGWFSEGRYEISSITMKITNKSPLESITNDIRYHQSPWKSPWITINFIPVQWFPMWKKNCVSPWLRLDLDKKCSKKPSCIWGPQRVERQNPNALELCDCTRVGLLVVGRTKKLWLRTWLYCIMLYIYIIHCTCIISGFKRQWLYIDFKSAAGCSSTADDEPQWWLMFLDGFKTHAFWVKCPKHTCFQTVILWYLGKL